MRSNRILVILLCFVTFGLALNSQSTYGAATQATVAATSAATAVNPGPATFASAATAPAATPPPPALNAPFAYGVASGDMTSDSAVLWTRTPSATTVTPELSLSSAFDNPIKLPNVQSSEASDFTVKVNATSLMPATQYYYRFIAGSDTSPVGMFKTAPAADQDVPVTFAFTGDADWKWKPYPLLSGLVKEKLDFFVFLGDLIYETTNMQGTTSVEDLAGYRWKYRENREPRSNSPSQIVPMRDLYAAFGQFSVFDNHETGLSKADKNAPAYNDGGATKNGQIVNQSAGFMARIQVYREYQPVDDTLITTSDDPRQTDTYRFYRTLPWGANLQLFILDDRSYRDSRLAKADDPAAVSCDRTMLGQAQLKWLEDQLLASQQKKITWKTIVISSPIEQLGKASQIGTDQDSTKSWIGGYDCERNRLLQFIDQNAIDNVVFLTTDNHYTVINNLMYKSDPADPKSPLKPARNAIEILSGPLGAGPGNPAALLKVDTKGLAPRDADRKILAVWNGDLPNSAGVLKGLKQAGLDPIGLVGFPNLVPDSVKAVGFPSGTIEPINFASMNSFAYAVLKFDKSSLTVRVTGIPSIVDPSTLNQPDAIKAYESSQPQDILSFTIKAN